MLVPKLRFKREDGTEFLEWEELSMNEIFTEIIEKNRPDLPVLSILQGQGTVYRDSSDRNILYDKKSTVNYKAMRKGDFIIHLRTFEGGLECATLDGISSPAYKILRTDKLIPEAYKAYFRSKQFIEGRLAIAVTGVRDGKNIEMSTFWQILVPVACLEEQQKIADFLSTVDEVITQSEAEVQNLAQQKKAAMQKIFSQEVRFKSEDGTDYPDLEEKNLSDICESIVGGGTPTTENKEYWNGSIAWVSSSDLQNDNIHYLSITRFITEDAISHSATKLIPQNSVLIVSRVGVGKVVIAPCQLCTSQDFTNLVNPQCNSVFLAYLLSVIMQKKASGVQGTSIKGITAKEIKMYDVSIPCLEEQQKIANFLSAYDEAITCAKQELEHWKQLKKGLLQQMFV